MIEDAYQARFEEALRLYQEAQGPDEYERALNIFLQLLGTNELPDAVRHESMLMGAKCMNVLRRFQDAVRLLRQLLGEIEPNLRDSGDLVVAANFSLAEALNNTGSWREAIDLFSETIAYFRQSGNWKSEAAVYQMVAQLWLQHSELKNAKVSFDAAWSILEPHELTPLHLQVLFGQGHCHYLEDDIDSAIHFEERALTVARHLGDTQTESALLSNLAKFTLDVQDFQRAIRYNARKLQEAKILHNVEEITRLLATLGSCYTETARSTKAIEMFDEASTLLSAHNQEETIQFGFCLLGKAQAFVDMKLYAESEAVLARARDLLERFAQDTELVDRIERRLVRESQAPMALDCAHRVLQMTLSGSSRNTEHHNPQPILDLTKVQYLTTELTSEDRAHFTSLYKELQDDLLQLRYEPASHHDAPGSFTMPLKFEYVDDVEVFEVKWNAFKQELMYSERCADVQDKWDQIKNRFSFVEGPFRGDKLDLIAYVTQLSEIAEICAALGNRDLLRRVSLHAADFLEIQTTDPMALALVWPVRARLMIAAHALAQSDCHQLLEIELRRCFDQLRNVFLMMNSEDRAAALKFIIETWFSGARILGRTAYADLVELVGNLVDSLDTLDRIRYALAVGEAVDPAEGVRLIDSLVARVRLENPNFRIDLAPEFEVGLAVQRFKSLAHDQETCLLQYGPFAAYIHNEVLDWTADVWSVSESEKNAVQSPALAFTAENLVVMDNRLKDMVYVVTILHEVNHQLRRAGQQLLTEDGKWLLVKRDVPIASAITYLQILQNGTLQQFAPQIEELINLGRNLAEKQPDLTRLHIKNMLHYFDDLGTHETRASYSCAAILLGMAFAYLDDAEAVESYIHHLQVMEHDDALVYGRKKASLIL